MRIADEKLGYKIREARMDKVPYMIVIGEKELQANMISVRARDMDPAKADMGQMSVEEFVRLIKKS